MSTTVEIPNGSAVLRDPATMTVRQKRPLQILVASLGPSRFEQIVTAQGNEEDPNAIERLALTEHEWDLMFRMTDATLWGLLESWTLNDSPQPLPATVDDVGDLPGDVYDALTAAATKIQADHLVTNGFGVEAVENPTSPTGPSET